ncbi:MAG: thioredoxin domain-containing protein [Saprospiraceae bacterium]|nr:thioredoxin domain-containing protein [Saprospiraceae bacterium]
MNRLKQETSPYLLQHANNPVDWYAWKPEAFRRAKEEDKPIMVSIGYSTCHWCHVMEHESFEDEAIAEYMNTHFVNIKVDREERPDVDQIYMEACQAISGSGGWPLNVFCTPEGKPFYAGTYFPPKGHLNRPSWIQVLHSINRSFREKREVVEEQAGRLTEYIAHAGKRLLKENLLDIEQGFQVSDLEEIYNKLLAQFDVEFGGFGGAPKFPQVSNLSFLHLLDPDLASPAAQKHVHFSLQKMIAGGIYDHLGGGFMRYATDQAWLVPHFEKMLYDNGLLLRLLANAWKSSGNPLYLEVIQQTLGFIRREMTGPEGGFYAALDADSGGTEGAFYVWNWSELAKVLGEDLELVAAYYGMKPEGNWEGTNIIWRQESDATFLEGKNIAPLEWKEKLEAAKVRLFEARAPRIRPGLDDKYLLDWNALMVTGLVEVYLATGLEEAKDMAVANLTFIEKTFTGAAPGDLKHVYTERSKEGAFYAAYLDDYAFYIEALLAGYQLDFDSSLILQASRYSDYLLAHFLDPENDLFYFTSGKETDLPVRRQDIFDSSTPSGNSVMVRNLLRLDTMLGKPAYRVQAERMLKRVLDSVKRHPGALCNWAIALFEAGLPHKEIAVVGPNAKKLAREIQASSLSNTTLMAATGDIEGFPLLENRATSDGRTLIYLCENYSCKRPVTTVEALFKELKMNDKTNA